MSPLARWGTAVASLAGFAAVLGWNVFGPDVRALLDAEADGTLCTVSATHLLVTLAVASASAGALSWSLGPSLAGRLGSLGLSAALLGLAALSLEADSISSLGFFAANNACTASTRRAPALLATFALFALLSFWRRGTVRAHGRPGR